MLFPVPLVAGDYISIVNQLKPNTITIIGETHNHPESITLFQSLISDHLKQNKCLTVGLEIASNQQLIIDKIKQGRAVISDIEISSIIDHPAFRKMINGLVKLQSKNECLKLVVIDAGDNIDLRRDEWMAIKLAEQIGETPILVLLGGLHTLKKVDWDLSMTKGSPSAAEILSSQGYNIKTYPQIWTNKTCADKNRFIKTGISESLSLLNNNYISMLNAFEYKTAEGVVDGILLWECKS
jgi:hypothetical protein